MNKELLEQIINEFALFVKGSGKTEKMKISEGYCNDSGTSWPSEYSDDDYLNLNTESLEADIDAWTDSLGYSK